MKIFVNSEPYNLYPTKMEPMGRKYYEKIINTRIIGFLLQKYGVDKYTKNKNTTLIKI
jgi:hypothetical protein